MPTNELHNFTPYTPPGGWRNPIDLSRLPSGSDLDHQAGFLFQQNPGYSDRFDTRRQYAEHLAAEGHLTQLPTEATRPIYELLPGAVTHNGQVYEPNHWDNPDYTVGPALAGKLPTHYLVPSDDPDGALFFRQTGLLLADLEAHRDAVIEAEAQAMRESAELRRHWLASQPKVAVTSTWLAPQLANSTGQSVTVRAAYRYLTDEGATIKVSDGHLLIEVPDHTPNGNRYALAAQALYDAEATVVAHLNQPGRRRGELPDKYVSPTGALF